MTELKYLSRESSGIESNKSYFSPALTKNICVILTAYNDEESIGKAVREFYQQTNVTNIIVVDNNSKDSTHFTALHAGAHVIREHNQGYGYACIRGWRKRCKEQTRK